MEYADHMRSLIGYNHWANLRVLGSAEPLSDVQLADEGLGYNSILGTLNHYLWAQAMWLERWRGAPNIDRYALDRAELWRRFAESDAAFKTFGADLTDDDFGRMIDYHSTEGSAHRRSLGQLVTHVVNHGTYHRGEAALMLTKLGRSPGDLDYVYFIPEEV